MKRAVSGEKGEKEWKKRRTEADRERWIMRTEGAKYFTAGKLHISHNISFFPSDSWV